MDFNPQIDRQAEDRCHRLGQTRPVKVCPRAAGPPSFRAVTKKGAALSSRPAPAITRTSAPRNKGPRSLSTHSPNTWLLTPGAPAPAPALVPQVYRLITKNSVDQNIYNLSQRKLRMDSAVLDGITTGKGGKADETVQMGAILHSLLMGEGQAGGPAPAASGPAAADGAAPVAANGVAA